MLAKNSYFGVFRSLALKYVTLAQICCVVCERTAQKLSNVFSPGLLTKMVSEIMAYFEKNIEFSLNLTFDDLSGHQYASTDMPFCLFYLSKLEFCTSDVLVNSILT